MVIKNNLLGASAVQQSLQTQNMQAQPISTDWMTWLSNNWVTVAIVAVVGYFIIKK